MKAAFITLDFINDLVHPDSQVSLVARQIADNEIISNTNEALNWAREHKMTIIHSRMGFSPGYPEGSHASQRFKSVMEHGAFLLNTWGTEFYSDLQVNPKDIIINKPRISAFYCSYLEAVLRGQNIDTLFICGSLVNFSVEHTTRDAHDRDYHVYVIKDCCGAYNGQTLEASLASIGRFASVVNLQDLWNMK